VPTVSSSAATDIYLYYGKADASDGEDATNVWDANFKGVWHFESDWNDSSGNGNTLIASGVGVTRVAGKIGNGVELLTSSSEYLEVDPWTDITAEPFTFESWAKPTSGPTYMIVSLGDKSSATNYHGLHFYASNDIPQSVKFRSYDGDSADAITLIAYTSGVYNYAVGVSSATNSRAVYLDGGNKATNATNQGVTGIDRLRIGVTADLTPWAYYSGIIDEVRISNIARGDAWIKFEYNNMIDVESSGYELTWDSEVGEAGEAPAGGGNYFYFFGM